MISYLKRIRLTAKIRVLVLRKCLRLTVCICPPEPTHKSVVPNLIAPSLNIPINGLQRLISLHVYLNLVVLDSLRE
jgi:hypothetical protein